MKKILITLLIPLLSGFTSIKETDKTSDYSIEITDIEQFGHVDGYFKGKFAGFNIFKARLNLHDKNLLLPMGFVVVEKHTLNNVTLAKIDTTSEEAKKNDVIAREFFKKHNLNYEAIQKQVSTELVKKLNLKNNS